ncbi:hypothetical protein DS843_27245 [Roseomonas genomospecies 6]|uniref:Uncharacterized protein n=1 Tax=Roseomonas genomospecies 6 TaxID=214106 RepID=A0A9W7NE06_9PROT|nr:hypothetical protein DS843_27245 [Roseomonas genomospecies 6]
MAPPPTALFPVEAVATFGAVPGDWLRTIGGSGAGASSGATAGVGRIGTTFIATNWRASVG